MQNPTIVAIRSLHRRKDRRAQGAFLVEGVRLVREAISAQAAVRQIALCPELLGAAAESIREEIAGSLAPLHLLTVAPAVMRSLTDTETPQGMIAVVDLPATPLIAFDATEGFVLVLDGVRDPGNVGTLIRAAAAANCDAVVVMAGSADPFAPKVVRSAMGAHFRVPLFAEMQWETIGPALAALPVVVGAAGDGPVLYDAVDWTRGCAIVIGNEDHGLSADARQWCTGTARIPMARGVESLNAALSGAIMLSEVARQRRQARTA
ncbi:MAG: RNA methyltransferase [Thermomicrobia bacterium]|nr:RNA methyltransferase [Thermomicrobia bacterium]